jgi:ferric-dicitrate binding protein FerR (iron transport regulator)
MTQRHEHDEIVARAERESGTFASSALGRATDHLAGKDAPLGDPIELWGRRIGRWLAVAAAIWLVAWLIGWFGR